MASHNSDLHVHVAAQKPDIDRFDLAPLCRRQDDLQPEAESTSSQEGRQCSWGRPQALLHASEGRFPIRGAARGGDVNDITKQDPA